MEKPCLDISTAPNLRKFVSSEHYFQNITSTFHSPTAMPYHTKKKAQERYNRQSFAQASNDYVAFCSMLQSKIQFHGLLQSLACTFYSTYTTYEDMGQVLCAMQAHQSRSWATVA